MHFRRSIIIAELWQLKTQDVEKSHILRFFLKNDPLREIFQNSVPAVFIALPIDMLCSNCVKCGPWEIGKSLPRKNKISPRSRDLAFAPIAPKICQGQPPRQCTQSSPDFIQIDSLSAKLYPNA